MLVIRDVQIQRIMNELDFQYMLDSLLDVTTPLFFIIIFLLLLFFVFFPSSMSKVFYMTVTKLRQSLRDLLILHK